MDFRPRTMKLLRSLFLMAGLATLAACAAQPEPVATAAPAPVAAPAPPAAIAPARQSFSVYFESGRADIRASAMQIIYQAWQEARANGTAKITVTGFADSAGKKAANKALSERRAQAVAGQFAKLGLNVAMDVSGKGEAAGSRRAADRRVEIVLEGGQVAADRHFAPVDALSGHHAASPAAPQDQPQAVTASVAADAGQPGAMDVDAAARPALASTAPLAAAPRGPPSVLTIVRAGS